MNILIIPSWYSTKKNPTNGSFFREQAMALKDAGHNVIVAFVEVELISFKSKNNKIDIYDDNGIKTYRIIQGKPSKTSNLGTAFAFNLGLNKIYKYIKEKEKVDIVHLHSCLWGGLGAVSISKKLNVPLVITEHSSYYARFKVRYLEDLMIKYILKNADKVISVSNSLKNILSKYKCDIEVLPNMVDCNKFSPKENLLSNKSNKDEFTFLSLCYLNKNKGIDILIRAFEKYLKKSNVKLVIGGDGPEKGPLIKLVKSLNISDKVEFKGALSREKVYEEINNCDAFILPSRFETFGVVLIEALSNGKPVISTKNGGANEIITKENGLLIDIDNVDQLGNAMICIIKNYEKYNKEKIRENCINTYDKKVIIEKLGKIYKNVLSLIE